MRRTRNGINLTLFVENMDICLSNGVFDIPGYTSIHI